MFVDESGNGFDVTALFIIFDGLAITVIDGELGIIFSLISRFLHDIVSAQLPNRKRVEQGKR
jgi:hypothetical protein